MTQRADKMVLARLAHTIAVDIVTEIQLVDAEPRDRMRVLEIVAALLIMRTFARQHWNLAADTLGQTVKISLERMPAE